MNSALKGRKSCSGAGAVPSAGSPQSHEMTSKMSGREASIFVTWSSLWSSFIGSLYCLLHTICLETGNQKERHIVRIQCGSLRPFTFALHQKSLNKRHDLYLIASLWVVATQVRASLTIFELSSVTSSWSESSLKCSIAFKASFQKKTRGKRALASQLCRVRACSSSGRREESKDVGRE